MARKYDQPFKRKQVSAKTPNQKTYIKAILNNSVTFCRGPSGTGKTHVAVGMAVHALSRGQVEKIYIVRPAVATEDLGYLPGDLEDKLGPYMRPVEDEFLYYSSHREMAEWRNSGELEVVPLAYMRGRNFHNAFIVCDEAQNTTEKQMKMLWSRLGMESTMVIVGDTEQQDIHDNGSGLDRAFTKFFDMDDVALVELDRTDIVRNPLVGKMDEYW